MEDVAVRDASQGLRVHILGNASVPTDPELAGDAFNQMAIRLCEALTETGCVTHFYGTAGFRDGIGCSVYVPVMEEKDYEGVTRFNDGSYLSWQCDEETVGKKIRIEQRFAENVTVALSRTVRRGDILLSLYAITTAFRSMFDRATSRGAVVVEALNMQGTCAATLPFANSIFSARHLLRQRLHALGRGTIPRNWKVIPPFYGRHEIEFCGTARDPRGPFLYMARMQAVKGAALFLEMAKRNPERSFWMAGDADLSDGRLAVRGLTPGETLRYDLAEYPNVRFMGFVGRDERKRLLGRVTALVQPTRYEEPFGLNVVEANLAGTPAVAPDRGGFVDTIVDGVTGIRVPEWTVDAYEGALDAVARLSPRACRAHALRHFAKGVVVPRFVEYLNALSGPERSSWLTADETQGET